MVQKVMVLRLQQSKENNIDRYVYNLEIQNYYLTNNSKLWFADFKYFTNKSKPPKEQYSDKICKMKIRNR